MVDNVVYRNSSNTPWRPVTIRPVLSTKVRARAPQYLSLSAEEEMPHAPLGALGVRLL